MVALTICAFAITVTILLLCQKLSVRFVLSSSCSITFDYSFFTLVLRKSKDNKESWRRKKKQPAIRPLTQFILRIIKSSKITVNKINVPNFGNDPYTTALIGAGVSSGVYTALNLILTLAKTSKISENAFTRDPSGATDTAEFDIVLETELYNLFFSGIILLYEEFKRRIARSYVRKSNK